VSRVSALLVEKRSLDNRDGTNAAFHSGRQVPVPIISIAEWHRVLVLCQHAHHDRCQTCHGVRARISTY